MSFIVVVLVGQVNFCSSSICGFDMGNLKRIMLGRYRVSEGLRQGRDMEGYGVFGVQVIIVVVVLGFFNIGQSRGRMRE